MSSITYKVTYTTGFAICDTNRVKGFVVYVNVIPNQGDQQWSISNNNTGLNRLHVRENYHVMTTSAESALHSATCNAVRDMTDFASLPVEVKDAHCKFAFLISVIYNDELLVALY